MLYALSALTKAFTMNVEFLRGFGFRSMKTDHLYSETTVAKVKTKRTLEERIWDANARGCSYLADANLAAERGDHAKAEKLYDKGQYWLDRYNKLVGDA